jgi:hypothetical protein
MVDNQRANQTAKPLKEGKQQNNNNKFLKLYKKKKIEK